jgi:hypothetical protein
MSKLEVDKVTPQSGTTLTIGEAGDTTVINGLGTLPATIGSATQVLSVNAGATGLEYGTAATDLSNLNATNLTSGTIPDGRFPSILPAAGGQNLTSLQPAAIVGGTFGAINAQNLTNIPGEISWQSTIITANSTIVASRGYWIDTTSNVITITLPASASVGDRIILTDYARKWGTNALTINQNSLNFQGSSSVNPVYNINGQSVDIVYSGATKGWIPNSDDDVTDESYVPPPYSIDFLVIAGGAGGGVERGGGGGAGGYRTSTQTVSGGTVITLTVGDGGAGSSTTTSGGVPASDGSSSSISGSGLTTITSAGGGGGGHDSGATTGRNGGSGGGAAGTNVLYYGGSGNTPATTPSQGNDGGANNNIASPYPPGGGGGAGASGNYGYSSQSGAGGVGAVSSITGSSVTYAGGGGGAKTNEGSAFGAGGAGGGGAGGNNTNGVNGTANTGGGGGGIQNSSSGYISGTGGKGVVIISMPDANYSETTTGSPTVATGVSGKTVLTFTGSGSYTA